MRTFQEYVNLRESDGLELVDESGLDDALLGGVAGVGHLAGQNLRGVGNVLGGLLLALSGSHTKEGLQQLAKGAAQMGASPVTAVIRAIQAAKDGTLSKRAGGPMGRMFGLRRAEKTAEMIKRLSPEIWQETNPKDIERMLQSVQPPPVQPPPLPPDVIAPPINRPTAPEIHSLSDKERLERAKNVKEKELARSLGNTKQDDGGMMWPPMSDQERRELGEELLQRYKITRNPAILKQLKSLGFSVQRRGS
jgi:hypothetical protein